MKFSRKRNQFTIFLVDLLILVASLFLTLLVRKMAMPTFSNFLNHLLSFLPIWFVWILAMYTLTLYSIDVPFTGIELPLKLFFSALFALFTGLGCFYIFKLNNISPKTILLLDILISYCLLLIWRYLYDYIQKKANIKNLLVLVVLYEKC